jgi:hypothetical protein
MTHMLIPYRSWCFDVKREVTFLKGTTVLLTHQRSNQSKLFVVCNGTFILVA